ncbi:uncharacterized protein [Dermacentor andersoni]|uniref:uncharacterized protein n=1 Tax=Dermacentor andersoni TaxID=34620 RepID=UPI0021556B3A|nr:uncharacterized protein LOC126519152 [Dermacentor andersoni]
MACDEYSIDQWRALLEQLTVPSTLSPVSADATEVEEWRPVNQRARLLARLVQRLCCQYRWRAAAEALEVLLAGHYPADQFSYKAGMLLHENLASPEKMNFFIRHSRCLLVADKKELALEYIVYCLKRMNFAHLRTFFQEHLKVDRKMLRPNEKLDAFIRGYLGLLDYLQWLSHASRSRHDDSADVDAHATAGESYEELTSVASALDKWRPLFTPDSESSASACQETTDVFLTKTLELLLRYDRADEAEDIVEGYMDSHADDCLHAALYAQALSKQRSPVTQESVASQRVELLQRVCEADPTNPQVLEYVQLIERNEQGEESVVECLRLLADFVDCPDNKDSMDAWQKLCYITLRTGHSEDAAVRDCGSRLWQERGDYWLPYHFSPHLDGSPDTWLLKALFLLVLGQTVGKAGCYISAVETRLLEHNTELLEKFQAAQEQVLRAPGLDHLLEEVLQAARHFKS